jgi:hypothetical protein
MSHRFAFTEGAVTLNDEQARIVHQPPTQNLRILASAGSGKTTTLSCRIDHLLTVCGAKANEIILLTFTHNAATVMRQRLEALVGCKRILCGTFHSLSQQILKAEAPAALTDLYHVDELPLKALDFLGSAKGRAWTKTLKWLFIDEFQDINDTQYNFIRALHHPAASVTIVGDDAQNIYTWRGSCVDYILNFHKRFPDVADFQLTTNYRSTSAIVAVANSIMRYIPTLDHKELMTASQAASSGERPAVHYFARATEERDWVTEAALKAYETGTTVILSKFNSVLYAYEAAFLKLGVRVRFVQGAEDESPMAKRTIFLSTFHSSKGLEWDHVFLVRMNDEVFPQQKDEDGVLQERRLFYVAVTRARRTLTLSYSRNHKSLSRFIREIHRPLLQWRGLPNYELSTLTSQIAPTTVQAWISILTGEDYRVIKALNLLPKTLFSLEPRPQHEETPWITPYWWTEQGMANEFCDFLQAFWHREIATLRPDSGGQWDREAHQVIWTIKIAAEDAATFDRHRDLFADLATRFFGKMDRGAAPPQIYYTEVLAAIPAATVKSLEQPEVIRIIQIIHKMRTALYNLRFANITLEEIRFAPIRHSPPQESRCTLIEAWRNYTAPSDTSNPYTLLGATYLIGLCRSLSEGRSGVLMNLPGAREWSRCTEFLDNLRGRIKALVVANKKVPIICRVQADLTTQIQCEADMLVGGVAWFFVSGDKASELHRLDRLLAVLLTTHALRKAGHTVTGITLFQIITGLTIEFAVDEWTSAPNLLVAFIQARVQHTV